MRDGIEIPNYRLERRIGRGAAGEVWLATHAVNGRAAAVKLLALAGDDGGDARRLFLREARTLAGFDHPNIVRVYDSGIVGELAYIAMEHLPAGTLLERMQREPTTVGEAISIVVQLAGALAAAHRLGVIHRDLKPANVIFRDEGTPVLTDFGAARLDGATTLYGRAGCIVGTPSYMSPEQICGEALRGNSDLYALGLIFHELLTGQRAHPGQSAEEILAQRLQMPVPALPSGLAMLQPVLERLLARDPAARFQNGDEAVERLRETFLSSAALRTQVGFGGSSRAWTSQLRALGFQLDARVKQQVRMAHVEALAQERQPAPAAASTVLIDRRRARRPPPWLAAAAAALLLASALWWAWPQPSPMPQVTASATRQAAPPLQALHTLPWLHTAATLAGAGAAGWRVAAAERRLATLRAALGPASSEAEPVLSRFEAALRRARAGVRAGDARASASALADVDAEWSAMASALSGWRQAHWLAKAETALARADAATARAALAAARADGAPAATLELLQLRLDLLAAPAAPAVTPAPRVDLDGERRGYRPGGTPAAAEGGAERPQRD